MNREKIILACLAAGQGSLYEPVQIQKLVFLFQKRASSVLKGSVYRFYPYDYGPFDPNVYNCLEDLANRGLVQIIGRPFDKKRFYRLSEKGGEEGQKVLESLSEPYKSFLVRLSEWVRSLSFAQLVGAVYNAYPEMRKYSVFHG